MLGIVGPIGMPELIIILVVALVIFGPKRLPELGRSLGKGIKEFKNSTSELTEHLAEDESAPAAPPTVDKAEKVEEPPASASTGANSSEAAQASESKTP